MPQRGVDAALELEPQKKLYLVSAAIWLGGLFLGWSFFLSGDLQRLSMARTAKSEEARKQEVLKNIAGLENEALSYKARFAKSGDVSWLVETLGRISKKTNVRLDSISSPEILRVGRYEKISLRLNAVCGYHELGDFVSQIESDEKLIKVSEVTLDKKVSESGSSLNAALVVSVFRAR